MVIVPKDFQDYDDDDERKEQRDRRYKYWQTLKNLRDEYLKETQNNVNNLEPQVFLVWVEEKYGIKPKLFDNHITDDYDIIDEKKYMVYVLKYG